MVLRISSRFQYSQPTQVKGRGWELIETAADWARLQGYSLLTLTTFADVPWNAPYYARLGFEIIPPHQLTRGPEDIRHHKASAGLDAWPRVAMKRSLTH